MVTSAGKAHCTWCGAVITGGRRFCGACGEAVDEDADDDEPRTVYRPASPQSPKLFKDALDVEQDQSPGVLGRLGRGLATAVGVPLAIVLALISFVISTALPILIVVALFIGPGDTWNMVRAWIPGSGGEEGRGDCEGFEDWYEASSARAERVHALTDPAQTAAVTDPAELRDILNKVRANALTQRHSSNPPAEAERLNGMMADSFDLIVQANRDALNGDSTNLQAYDSKYQVPARQVNEEETRVRQACA